MVGPDEELQFEWDADKAAANLTKHGVSFLTAAETFAEAIVERIDDREDYGEARFVGLGRVGLDVYRIVYTWRGARRVRIISAQKAGKHERDIYYRQTFA